jgi:hypothetical protein
VKQLTAQIKSLLERERQHKKQEEKLNQTIAKLQKKLASSKSNNEELERLRKSLVESEHKRRQLENQIQSSTPNTTDTSNNKNTNIETKANSAPLPSVDVLYELFSWMTLALKLNTMSTGSTSINDIDKPTLFQYLMDQRIDYTQWSTIIMNALQGKEKKTL